MDDDKTARLGLPLLYPGQAQKELTHNEALVLLDLVCGGSVEATGLDAPPPALAIGDAWIVGDAPTGAWAGHPRTVAGWTAGGWRFVAPWEGLAIWSRANGAMVRFDGTAWRGGVIAAIAEPAGGTTVDAPAREAISAILAALRGHGLISR